MSDVEFDFSWASDEYLKVWVALVSGLLAQGALDENHPDLVELTQAMLAAAKAELQQRRRQPLYAVRWHDAFSGESVTKECGDKAEAEMYHNMLAYVPDANPVLIEY